MKTIKSTRGKEHRLLLFLAVFMIFMTTGVFLFYPDDKYAAFDQYDILSFCDSMPEPVFSVAEGIYDQPFELEINTPSDDAVFFTTDGSIPTTRSQRYQKRIYIDPQINLNRDILYIPTSFVWQWRPPYGRQNHCTVVRARCFRAGTGYGPVKNMIYSSSGITQHQGFQIIHVLIESDSLFSPTKGFYVVGQKYYSKASLVKNDVQLSEMNYQGGYPANYFQRGLDWRRPATFILMNLSGKTFFEQNITVGLGGRFSRVFPEKTLRIMPDSQNDTVIRYPLFDELPYSSYKNIKLRNSGQDFSYTMFRDVLMHRLVGGTNVDGLVYTPSVVYINGNYWGIHNVVQKQDEHFLADKYASSLSNISIIDHFFNELRMKCGDESSIRSFEQLLNFIRENSLANHETYHAVCTQIDVDNFIDYMILETFFDNWDWPDRNIRLYRFDQQTETMKQQGIDAGKWRWFFFDLDSGMPPEQRTFGTLRERYAQEFTMQIFEGFLENETFKEKFIARYEYLVKNNLTSEKMLGQINALEESYQDEMKRHIARWRTHRNLQSWKEQVDILKNFAKERPVNVLEQLKTL